MAPPARAVATSLAIMAMWTAVSGEAPESQDTRSELASIEQRISQLESERAKLRAQLGLTPAETSACIAPSGYSEPPSAAPELEPDERDEIFPVQTVLLGPGDDGGGVLSANVTAVHLSAAETPRTRGVPAALRADARRVPVLITAHYGGGQTSAEILNKVHLAVRCVRTGRVLAFSTLSGSASVTALASRVWGHKHSIAAGRSDGTVLWFDLAAWWKLGGEASEAQEARGESETENETLQDAFFSRLSARLTPIDPNDIGETSSEEGIPVTGSRGPVTAAFFSRASGASDNVLTAHASGHVAAWSNSRGPAAEVQINTTLFAISRGDRQSFAVATDAGMALVAAAPTAVRVRAFCPYSAWLKDDDSRKDKEYFGPVVAMASRPRRLSRTFALTREGLLFEFETDPRRIYRFCRPLPRAARRQTALRDARAMVGLPGYLFVLGNKGIFTTFNISRHSAVILIRQDVLVEAEAATSACNGAPLAVGAHTPSAVHVAACVYANDETTVTVLGATGRRVTGARGRRSGPLNAFPFARVPMFLIGIVGVVGYQLFCKAGTAEKIIPSPFARGGARAKRGMSPFSLFFYFHFNFSADVLRSATGDALRPKASSASRNCWFFTKRFRGGRCSREAARPW